MLKKVEEVIFDRREDAETILNKLVTMVYDYGKVTVYDLYHFIGCSNVPENCTYGWTDLSSASVITTGYRPWGIGVRECYRLQLPEVVELSRTKLAVNTKDGYGTVHKDDNDVILKLLGTEYCMTTFYDDKIQSFNVRITNAKGNSCLKGFSELHIRTAKHNVLLQAIKDCINSLEDVK
jgi:hypothetical protein